MEQMNQSQSIGVRKCDMEKRGGRLHARTHIDKTICVIWIICWGELIFEQREMECNTVHKNVCIYDS